MYKLLSGSGGFETESVPGRQFPGGKCAVFGRASPIPDTPRIFDPGKRYMRPETGLHLETRGRQNRSPAAFEGQKAVPHRLPCRTRELPVYGYPGNTQFFNFQIQRQSRCHPILHSGGNLRHPPSKRRRRTSMRCHLRPRPANPTLTSRLSFSCRRDIARKISSEAQWPERRGYFFRQLSSGFIL